MPEMQDTPAFTFNLGDGNTPVATTFGFKLSNEELEQVAGIRPEWVFNLRSPDTSQSYQRFMNKILADITASIQNNLGDFIASRSDLNEEDWDRVYAVVYQRALDRVTEIQLTRESGILGSSTLKTIAEIQSAASPMLDDVYTADGMRIGQEFFGPEYLDPSTLSIDEVYPSRRMSSLRSDGDVAIKSSRSMTEITVDLVFSGEQAINQRLRPLIAELYASPVTTIESSLLIDVLINRFASPEVEQRVYREIVNQASQDENIDNLLSNLEDVALTDVSSMLDIIGNDDFTYQILRARARRAADIDRAPQTKTVVHEDELTVSIPVIATSVIVATDPSATNTMHVQIRFVRIHHHAFEKFGVLYRDLNGEPTPDITKCPWLAYYKQWAYMNPEQNPAWLLSKYTPTEDVPDLVIKWSDLLLPPGQEPDKVLPNNKSGSNFVVESVNAAYQTKAVLQPIIGNKYPTPHVMGKGGVTARVVLKTTDRNLVRQFHLMKDELDAISRNVSGQYRHEYATVQNSVLNLLGSTRFIITTVRTTPMKDSANGYEISLTLEEASYSQESMQSLWLHNTTIGDGAIKALWEWLWEGYQIWLDLPHGEDSLRGVTDPSRKKAIYAVRTLFGNDLKGGGVLNGSVINAGLMAFANRTSGGNAPYSSQRLVPSTYRYMFSQQGAPLISDTPFSPGDVKVWMNNIFDFDNDVLFKRYAVLMGYDPQVYFGGADLTSYLKNKTFIEGNAYAWEEIPEINARYYGWNGPDIVTNAAHVLVADFNRSFLGFGSDNTNFMWFKSQFLTADYHKQQIRLRKDFYDELLTPIMHPQTPPKGVLNLAAAAGGDKPRLSEEAVWKVKDLTYAYNKLIEVFQSGEVLKFPGFDWKKHFDPRGTTKIVNVTQGNGLPDGPNNKMAYNNYPDMPLPTYRDFIGTSDSPGYALLQMPEGLKTAMQIRGGGSRELWTQFAPLYSDFGRIPMSESFDIHKKNVTPLSKWTTIADHDESGSSEGRGRFNMPMEPGFWFYKKRMADEIVNKANELVAESGTVANNIKEAVGGVIQLDLDLEYQFPDSADTWNNLIRTAVQEERIRQEAGSSSIAQALGTTRFMDDLIATASEEKKVIDIVGHRDRYIGRLIPHRGITSSNPTWEFVTHRGPRVTYVNWRLGESVDLEGNSDRDYHRSVLTRMIQRMPDDTYGIERMFPAYRLYFIEWDDNAGREYGQKKIKSVRLIDDLYSTHAVLSMTVTDRKDDSAVAVVEILNTVGTFDKDSFVTDQAQIEKGAGRDDANEDFLARMKLRTGVGIMIQMGYTSDRDSLETVFTGQIAEIKPGKVITFIAQGWKTELDQELNVATDTTNDRAAISFILNDEERPLPHLARRFNTEDLTNSEIRRLVGDAQAVEDAYTSWWGLGGRAGYFRFLNGGSISDVDKNIWFNHIGDRNPLGSAALALTPKSMEHHFVANTSREWRFFRTTMWEATKEIVRANPGLIVSVVPFDTEATLFVGYPDQQYLWRRPSGFEKKLYDKYVIPARIKETITGLGLLLKDFYESRFGTSDGEQERRDIENAAFWGNRKEGDGLDRNSAGAPIGFGDRIGGYIRGSRLGGNREVTNVEDGSLHGRLFSFLSPSYTGFMKWALQAKPYDSKDVQGSVGWYTDPLTHIPLVESEQYDLSKDWQTIGSFSPSLQEFLVSFFYRLRFIEPGGYSNSGQQTAVSSKLMPVIGQAMGRLRNYKNQLTGNGETVYRELLGNEFGDAGPSALGKVSYGDYISAFWSNPNKTVEGLLEQVDQDVREGNLTADDAFHIRQLFAGGLYSNINEPGGGNIFDNFDIVTLWDESEQHHVRRQGILRDADDPLGLTIFKQLRAFRILVHYFAKYLDSGRGQKTFKIVNDGGMSDILATTNMPPWFRNFRRYHLVQSSLDIIDNSIVASESQMANACLVRGPTSVVDQDEIGISEGGKRTFVTGEEWASYPPHGPATFNNNIDAGQRRLFVAIEPNAIAPARQANMLSSNMAQAIRPMYRGRLKVTGRVIKPYDVVQINDHVNSMTGYIEADVVTHEFTAETGWVTTIEPHALVTAHDPWANWSLSIWNQIMGGLDVAESASWLWLLWGFMTLGGGTLIHGAIKGVRAGLTRIGQNRLKSYLRKTAGSKGAQAVEVLLNNKNASSLLRKLAKEEVEVMQRKLTQDVITGVAKQETTTRLGQVAAAETAKIAARKEAVLSAQDIAKAVGRRTLTFAGAYGLFQGGSSMLNQWNTAWSGESMPHMPVKLTPLNYRGLPLTAGLNLKDKDMLSWGAKAELLWKDSMAGLNSFFAGIEDEPVEQS